MKKPNNLFLPLHSFRGAVFLSIICISQKKSSIFVAGFFFQMWVKIHRFGQKTQKIFGQFKKLLYLCTVKSAQNIKMCTIESAN